MIILRPLAIAAIVTGILYALSYIPRGGYDEEPKRYSDEVSTSTVFIAIFILLVIAELFFG